MSARSTARRIMGQTEVAAAEPASLNGTAAIDTPRHATVHEAKTHLSRLLTAVESGETVVITRRGKPVARLEPIVPARKRPVFGSMKGLIAFDDRFFEPLPDDELAPWGEM